ncbi:cytochrome C oxidase subunit II [Paenibacillus sacheonensis]|uniref:Cytochrome C oxidase subunit II n=1 Tax=Paenibacillus sacheonensis TaxID=742054 RepID=A0A7X4YJZ9_9BACL|nr:cytochrome C oxidase subunit II [Paenibacillus sacheonensis]MBM7563843.1 cytochrome c oxidase subunit 2 [Paenibacillus sacheonensis]NBC67808.1 cytochrome C oxidase subunit II [Paenibacillus sacheonensis]
MHKWIMFVVFAAASVLGIYLLTTQLPDKPVDEAASLPPGVTLLKVEASQDFVFDQKEYHAKVGDKVIVKLHNKSGIHGLAIPELGVDLEGDKLEQEVTLDKAGTYEMHCAVMCGTGHANMKSVLIVE